MEIIIYKNIRKVYKNEGEVSYMGILEVLIIILILAWLGGLSLHVAGGAIHLLLVVALIVLVYKLLKSEA